MNLSKKDIEHIAHLARLRLSPKEIEQYRREISGIVRYVDQLAEVNTKSLEPTARVGKGARTLRTDSALPWNEEEREAALSGAAERHGRSIKTKRILE